jgi:hypothetical protein
VSWQDDKRWSDRFIPEIKSILGRYLISEAPAEEDRERNSDLMVFRFSNEVRVACRIRRHKYHQKFYNDFTIRCSRPTGQRTELGKLMTGWGSHFFYGFSNADETALCDWFLGDLTELRDWAYRELIQNAGRMPGHRMSNHDGSSDFWVFDRSALPAAFFVADAESHEA